MHQLLIPVNEPAKVSNIVQALEKGFVYLGIFLIQAEAPAVATLSNPGAGTFVHAHVFLRPEETIPTKKVLDMLHNIEKGTYSASDVLARLEPLRDIANVKS